MRITLVGPTYPFRGGISHHTMLLARQLREQHMVRLISFRRQYPTWLYPGTTDRDPASDSALRVPDEPLLDGINPLTWWRVAATIRRDAPDLLVLQWTVSYWAPLLWLLLRRRAPTTHAVVLVHNAAPHERAMSATMSYALQRHVLSLADSVVCHAVPEEVALREMLPTMPIERVPMPTYAAIAQSDSEPPQGVAEGSPHLLFFGLVRHYKGVDLLLDALERLRHELPDVHLTIAGEWWENAGDPERLITPSLRPHVTLLNHYLPNEQLAPLFHRADVVVMPYRSATQSGVVQLAFGFGVPVIATAVGGLPDAIQHEVSGLLIPPNDPAILADTILRYHREGWRERLAPGVAVARSAASWALVEAALLKSLPSHP